MPVLQTGLAKSAAEDYTIDNSLRFNVDDDSYLGKTFAAAGNQKTWTFSCWYKQGTPGNTCYHLAQAASTENYAQFYIDSTDQIRLINKPQSGTGGNTVLFSTPVFRDPGAWYHLVCKYDTTPSTPGANDVAMFVNGEKVTDLGTADYPDQNDEGYMNGTEQMTLGFNIREDGEFDGYMAEVYFIDGQALDADSFGETDAATNQWKPLDSDDVKDAVTFGTNGFYQKYAATELANSFTDSSAVNWTAPAGITSVDYLVVGGGGSGASEHGGSGVGGGGAGGMLTGTLAVVPGTTYTVTVGAGGASAKSTGSGTGKGIDGADSVFASITATGGGGGGCDSGDTNVDGGSGGGGGNGGSGGSGVVGQGNDGGDAGAGQGGGGGGGAGAVGGNQSGGVGGSGGSGTASSITGASVTYAGGGGASGGSGSDGSGGSGGGGAGNKSGNGVSGTDGLGGGGGGTRAAYYSGAGGSGIVVLDDGTTVTSFTSTHSAHTITANGDVANSRAQSKVGDSSIKFDGTGDYLSIPTSTDWDFTASSDFTVEFWMYIGGNQVDYAAMLNRGDTSSPWNGWTIQFLPSAETIRMANNADGSGGVTSSGAVAQDAWHHYAFVHDDSADTLKLYIDGTEDASETASTAIAWTNTAFPLAIGNQPGFSRELDGYLDEIRISDTARYTSSFTPSTTEFTADSNTKLLIHSDWDGGLGADSSGNENDFAVTNLVATDQMVDSPTNNWCTMNPLDTNKVNAWNTAPTFSEGNLKTVTAGSNSSQCCGTMAMQSGGKWGFKYTHTDGNTDPQGEMIGIVKAEGYAQTTYLHNQDMAWFYYAADGNAYHDSSGSSFGSALEIDDYLEFLLDTVGGTLKVKRNGSLIGTNMFSSLDNTDYLVAFDGDSTSGMGGVFDFGQSGYEPSDSDYKTICSSNLASPEIALPTDHFNTLLYTGTGGSGQSLTGVGFQPDMMFLKRRDAGSTGWGAMDVVRGAEASSSLSKLTPNAATAEESSGDTYDVISFDSDGFTVGEGYNLNVNVSSGTYATWNWKAGGAAVSNTDGTITSSVSANPTAGFSIASYTGTGSAATIGHGLSSAPELIIVKNRDEADAWQVGSSKGIDFTDYLVLDTNAAAVDNVDRWNDTAPSASVFTIGDGVEVNTNTEDYIAYCFHSIEGYSKVGSYEGNGVVDGTFIYTGMKPSYLLIKRTDASFQWYVWDDKRDTINPNDIVLYPSLSDAEDDSTDYSIDFLSNGFKIRNASNLDNNSSGTYIYLAIAESPFKTSNAR